MKKITLIIQFLLLIFINAKALDEPPLHFSYEENGGSISWTKKVPDSEKSWDAKERKLEFHIKADRISSGARDIKIGEDDRKTITSAGDTLIYKVPQNVRKFQVVVYLGKDPTSHWVFLPDGTDTNWDVSTEEPEKPTESNKTPNPEQPDNLAYGPRPLINNSINEENKPKLCKECKGKNHRLYIDASNNITNNKGVLLQKYNCEENSIVYKNTQSIRVGSDLSIWIDNFNVNKFKYIKATTGFLDFTYSDKSLTFFTPTPSTDVPTTDGTENEGNGLEAAASDEEKDAIKTLQKFLEFYYTLIQAKKDLENRKGHFLSQDELITYKTELDKYITTLNLGDKKQWNGTVQNLDLPSGKEKEKALALQVDYLYKYIVNYPTSIKTNILPIQTKNGDKITITIIGQEKGESTEKELGSYSFRMKGGFKLGVSPIVVFHGLKDEAYYYKDSTRVSSADSTQTESFSILKEDSQANKFGGYGIGTMLNGYFRTGSLINVGFGVGTFVPFEDSPRFRFLSGLSFEIAEEKYRFSLHFGLALGKTKTLMPEFYNQQEFDTRPQGDILRDEWTQSWYIGFGYGLPINTKGDN